jgi:hypothetical protein
MSGNSKASLLKNVGVVSISLKQGDFPLLVAPGCTKTEEEPIAWQRQSHLMWRLT